MSIDKLIKTATPKRLRDEINHIEDNMLPILSVEFDNSNEYQKQTKLDTINNLSNVVKKIKNRLKTLQG